MYIAIFVLVDKVHTACSDADDEVAGAAAVAVAPISGEMLSCG